jgi:carbohydrate-binding DOMON domain-containing protein
MKRLIPALSTVAAALLLSPVVLANKVKLEDPKGDDNGPGQYTYPTGAEYKKGSFDLTSLEVKEKGSDIELAITIAVPFEDPWDSKKWPNPGNGFSLQMFQVYVDTDGKEGSGEKESLPGMNAEFAEDSRWEKMIFISPQSNKTILSELKQKAPKLVDKVILPKKVAARGKTVTATFAKKDLGAAIDKVGWQVLVGSNEGYPKGNDILSRKVNEFEGEHRFGGGNDGEADPHFIDCLAGKGKGGDDEKAAQHEMLKYDAEKNTRAQLKMIRN